jgi:hypothetical protein
MNKIDFLKLQSLFNIRHEVKPKTYLDELAENGFLDEYLENFFKTRTDYDLEFKERIYEAYFNYSKGINENLEIYYLERMCESLSFFNEYTEQCWIQKL